MIALLVAVRGLHLASVMLLFGSAMLLQRLGRGVPELGRESAPLRRARLVCAGVALLTAPAWLALAAGQMAGDAKAMTDPAALWLTLSGTLFGQMLAARFVLLLALGLAVGLRREAAAALLAGLALTSISVTSHAAAASPAHFTAIGITADTLHLLCGGFWIGGLAVLASIMVQRRETPRLHDALSLYASWAMIAVALLALTGLLNAATIVLGGEGHATRPYVGVLAAKLLLVWAMILLALTNHFHLMPRLERLEARRALKGNIGRELALGAAVVVLGGLMGLLPPTL